jgi:hypothetical protein
MRSCRMPVLLSVAVTVGLMGIVPANAAISSSSATVRADGGEEAMQSPYEDTREMADIYQTHRLTD